METKLCNCCNMLKPENDFNIFYNTKKLRGYCRVCEKNKRANRDEQYRLNNREKMKLSSENYRKKNEEKVKKYDKDYRENNKEKIRIKNKNWRNKVSSLPIYKVKNSVSKMISKVIKRNGYSKKSRTHEILGCSYEEFKKHLESQWETWMNWDNYGNPKDGILEPNKTWDIDHVIPLSNAINEEDLIGLNHFSNLQPLCSHYNRNIKKDN
jgi:hypothetical protein